MSERQRKVLTVAKSIKEWPKSERPREQLLNQGAGALSDAELLAVILRNGVQGKDATSLARELLAQFGGMRGLLSADQGEIQKRKGSKFWNCTLKDVTPTPVYRKPFSWLAELGQTQEWRG